MQPFIPEPIPRESVPVGLRRQRAPPGWNILGPFSKTDDFASHHEQKGQEWLSLASEFTDRN